MTADAPRPARRNEGKWFALMQNRFRMARFKIINRLIETLLAGRETLTILDVGGRAEYWNMLAPHLRPKVHVTLLNHADELALYSEHVAEGLRFTNVAGNGCNMPEYADWSFDLVHSNSVIEHVGSYANMFNLADEIRRSARPITSRHRTTGSRSIPIRLFRSCTGCPIRSRCRCSRASILALPGASITAERRCGSMTRR